MAKADPPKKREPKYGTAAATGAGYGVMSGAKKAKKGFTPYNKETSYKRGTVRRTVISKLPDISNPKVPIDVTQRVSTTKSFSKYGVKTTSTLTETYSKYKLQPYTHHEQGFRTSSRSTTLSGRGKLSKLGQIVIKETKPAESIGKGYQQQSGKMFDQGGKGGGKGRYTTKSITYAKEGYPTPKPGRVPKGGNPVVSSLKRTNIGAHSKIEFFVDDITGKAFSHKVGGSKGKNIYKTLVAPQTRAGQFIQSKSAAQLFSAASGAAKVAGKIIGAGNIVGTAILAYDAVKFGQQYRKDNPQKEYKGYSYNK